MQDKPGIAISPVDICVLVSSVTRPAFVDLWTFCAFSGLFLPIWTMCSASGFRPSMDVLHGLRPMLMRLGASGSRLDYNGSAWIRWPGTHPVLLAYDNAWDRPPGPGMSKAPAFHGGLLPCLSPIPFRPVFYYSLPFLFLIHRDIIARESVRCHIESFTVTR